HRHRSQQSLQFSDSLVSSRRRKSVSPSFRVFQDIAKPSFSCPARDCQRSTPSITRKSDEPCNFSSGLNALSSLGADGCFVRSKIYKSAPAKHTSQPSTCTRLTWRFGSNDIRVLRHVPRTIDLSNIRV